MDVETMNALRIHHQTYDDDDATDEDVPSTHAEKRKRQREFS